MSLLRFFRKKKAELSDEQKKENSRLRFSAACGKMERNETAGRLIA